MKKQDRGKSANTSHDARSSGSNRSKQPDKQAQKETPYIFGFHPVESLVEQTGFHSSDILYLSRADQGRVKRILQKAQKAGIDVRRVNQTQLDSLCGGENHQGIVLHRQESFNFPEFSEEEMFEESNSGVYVALDGVNDPHNVGAIIRSMAAFSAKGCVVPKKRSAPVGGSALKSSAGALLKIPVLHVSGLPNFLLKAREHSFYVIGADLDGEIMTSEMVREILEVQKKILLVFGAEQDGLSRLVKERCHSLLRIDQSTQIDSLNISASAAIFLYEFSKNS